MSNQSFRRVRERATRAELLESAPPISEWPSPLISGIKGDSLHAYQLARRAVQLWVADGQGATIRRETGLELRRARALALQCMEIDPETRRVVGFWACVPGYRRHAERRQRVRTFKATLTNQGKGLSGALEALFTRYPELYVKFEEYVNKRRESGSAPVSRLTIQNIFDRFIALCKEYGLRTRNEWPFTVKRRGYEAVRRWYNKMRHQKPAQTIKNEMGDDAASVDKVDRQAALNPRTSKTYLAYERVELDEHHEDAQYSIVNPIGNDFVHVAAERAYALVMRDCGSHVALSACTSFGPRYGTRDILKLVHSAMVPPARQHLIIKNEHFAYDEDACYPGELSDFAMLTWQILALDADRAHFSAHTLEALKHDIGCDVYGERIGEPTARYGIEGFFKGLATLMGDLPSATGNKPTSAARRDPEAAAKRWCIVGPIAEQALDVMVRNYNVTPTAQCAGLSPLQQLHEMLARGRVYRSPLGELRQANLFRFLPRYVATLNRKRGPLSMSPFGVNLFGGRYVGPELTKDVELSLCGNMGVRVYVQEDARYAFVVPDAFLNRSYPVVLSGAYSDIPHTLDWRRHTYNWRKNQHIKGKVSTAALATGLLRGMGEAAKTNKAAATFLAATQAFMDRWGRDDLHYVDMTPSMRAQLDEFAITMAETAAEEGYDQEEGASATVYAPTPHILVPGKAVSAPYSDGGTFDPFGLL